MYYNHMLVWMQLTKSVNEPSDLSLERSNFKWAPLRKVYVTIFYQVIVELINEIASVHLSAAGHTIKQLIDQTVEELEFKLMKTSIPRPQELGMYIWCQTNKFKFGYNCCYLMTNSKYIYKVFIRLCNFIILNDILLLNERCHWLLLQKTGGRLSFWITHTLTHTHTHTEENILAFIRVWSLHESWLSPCHSI